MSLISILAQAPHLIPDWLHFVEGSWCGDCTLKEWMDFQPGPFSLSRWSQSCVFQRVFPSPGWAPGRALGSCIPRMMLNSERWDMVDELPTSFTLNWDDLEVCPHRGSPAELRPVVHRGNPLINMPGFTYPLLHHAAWDLLSNYLLESKSLSQGLLLGSP